jgi:hypothetical protein
LKYQVFVIDYRVIKTPEEMWSRMKQPADFGVNSLKEFTAKYGLKVKRGRMGHYAPAGNIDYFILRHS